MSEGPAEEETSPSEPPPASDGPEDLLPGEVFWRDHQRWLEERGYLLRPRYRPDWVPSWKGTDANSLSVEDGRYSQTAHILDATRVSDGELVLLKRISIVTHPHEIEIGQYFSQEPLASHPRNHCIPIYDVLQPSDDNEQCIIVMPLLRRYNNPRFKSIGEAVEFFRQIFEGLQFMHQCRVAHRDCMDLNIMMDPKPTFPNMYHPRSLRRNRNFKGNAKYYTRTARPTKYFLIDFGLSRKYSPDNMSPRELPILGGDKTVPEFQNATGPLDPFPTDIYYLGNLIREDFLQKTRGVEFMQPLVNDMVQDDPSKRPTIHEVVERFEKILSSLSSWTLRSRLVSLNEGLFDRSIRAIHHFFRTTTHIVTGRKALPTP